MSQQTVTQTQTLSDAPTDWTDTIGFQQFNPDQGTLQAIGVGVTGDVDGSVSIENLGPVTATSDIALLGTVSVIGPGDTRCSWLPIRRLVPRSHWHLMTGR